MTDFKQSLKWYLIFGKMFGVVFFSLEKPSRNKDNLYFVPYLFVYVFSITYRLMFQKFLYYNRNYLLAIVENLTDNFLILSQLTSLTFFYCQRKDIREHLIAVMKHSLKLTSQLNRKPNYLKKLFFSTIVLFVIADIILNSYINFSFYCVFLTPIRTMIFEQQFILKIMDENKTQIEDLRKYLQKLKSDITENNYFIHHLKRKHSYYKRAMLLTEKTNSVFGIPILLNMLNTLLITISLLNYLQHNARGSNKYDLKFFINYTWLFIIILKLYDVINKWSIIVDVVSLIIILLITNKTRLLQMDNTATCIHDLWNVLAKHNKIDCNAMYLKNIAFHLRNNKLMFTAYGLFVLDWQYLQRVSFCFYFSHKICSAFTFQMIAGVTTYVVILVQFQLALAHTTYE